MSGLSKAIAMVALHGLAATQGMSELPVIGREMPKRHKGNESKCKSCSHYMTRRRCCTPMQMACDEYKRKKRKK